MKINWFPGHMNKGLREIKEKAKFIDLFIITIDSRLPNLSYNNEFDEILKNKNKLFLLTKTDLADPYKNKFLKNEIYQSNNTLKINLKKTKSKKKILFFLDDFFEKKLQKVLKKGYKNSIFKIMVIGIPNSGKSTLINLLSNSKKAKTANYPGVTRNQQWIVHQNYYFLDTPGILWPKINNEIDGFKLLLTNSIKQTLIKPNIMVKKYFEIVSIYHPNKIKKLKLNPVLIEDEIAKEIDQYCNLFPNLSIHDCHNKLINYFINLKGVTYE